MHYFDVTAWTHNVIHVMSIKVIQVIPLCHPYDALIIAAIIAAITTLFIFCVFQITSPSFSSCYLNVLLQTTIHVQSRLLKRTPRLNWRRHIFSFSSVILVLRG